MNIQKIFSILLYLLPWFISSIIFKIDINFYNNLNLPVFAPPPIIFAIIWPILYILISISVYKVINKSSSNYTLALIINYLSNQLFTFFFFILKNNFLSLLDTITILISSIFLYKETKKIDKKSSNYLIPYILWNIFASILIYFTSIMN